jgi:hypothetical protein
MQCLLHNDYDKSAKNVQFDKQICKSFANFY